MITKKTCLSGDWLMVELHNWAYKVEMGCGTDSWRLYGQVYGHPNYESGEYVYISTPKQFDKDKMQIIGASGRQYQLFACSGDLEKEIVYIEADIRNNGSEHW